ncbi:MAG: flagellar export protein FliJ [Clostridium sp.]|nr:flagellar export protein FliJ [Clostridium sp.]
MARGRKKYTLEEQYDLTVKQISETESVLKEFKAKKKELEAQLKEKQLSELSSLIESTGLSIEEIKGLIKKEETE